MSNVIKIDVGLKKRVEVLLKKGNNKIEFPSVKNFVDKAVLEFLEKIEKRGGK